MLNHNIIFVLECRDWLLVAGRFLGCACSFWSGDVHLDLLGEEDVLLFFTAKSVEAFDNGWRHTA